MLGSVSAAIDPAILEIAHRELTAAQFETWELSLQGESQRGISYRLDLARSTITDRLDAANRRMRARGVRFAPDGQPYVPQKSRTRVERPRQRPHQKG